MSWSIFKQNMTSFLTNERNPSAAGIIDATDMPTPFMVDILDTEGNVIGQEQDTGEAGVDKELRLLAMKIADEYHNAIASSFQGTRQISSAGHSALYSLRLGIFTAIFLALKRSQAKGDKPSTLFMTPIGLAVVAYWTAAMVPITFKKLPVPAGISSPITGVQILFPGNPRPIIKGFKDAFSKYNEERDYNIAVSKMLDDIINGFEKHLDSITGVYFGLSTSVPSFPVIIPWKGIKVI